MDVGWHYHANGVVGLEINFQMCIIYGYLHWPDIEEVINIGYCFTNCKIRLVIGDLDSNLLFSWSKKLNDHGSGISTNILYWQDHWRRI